MKPRRLNPELRRAVMARDGMCFLARVDPAHVCRDVWGDRHSPDDLNRLTIEHVKDEPMMGRKAPDSLTNLIVLCGYANVAVPSKAERVRMRDYLRAVNA